MEKESNLNLDYGWRAHCVLCNWRGILWPTMQQARMDGRQHEDFYDDGPWGRPHYTMVSLNMDELIKRNQTEATSSMRLLTEEEISRLDTVENVIKISIDFGKDIEPEKELTVKEFLEKLNNIKNSYENTAIEPLFYVLTRCYFEKCKVNANEIITPPKSYIFAPCGSCGCHPTARCAVGHIGCYLC